MSFAKRIASWGVHAWFASAASRKSGPPASRASRKRFASSSGERPPT
jgi:hypothetical protein